MGGFIPATEDRDAPNRSVQGERPVARRASRLFLPGCLAAGCTSGVGTSYKPIRSRRRGDVHGRGSASPVRRQLSAQAGAEPVRCEPRAITALRTQCLSALGSQRQSAKQLLDPQDTPEITHDNDGSSRPSSRRDDAAAGVPGCVARGWQRPMNPNGPAAAAPHDPTDRTSSPVRA
jgi:hypothetical protein